MCTNRDLERIFETAVNQFLPSIFEDPPTTRELTAMIRRYFTKQFPKLKLRCRTWKLAPIGTTQRIRIRLQVVNAKGVVAKTVVTHLIY